MTSVRLAIQCLSLANCILVCASFAQAEELATGKILVASRKLGDPNFSETVILLTNYNERGAMGLILNRPSDVPLSKAWPGAKTGALSLGGPVEVFRVMALRQRKDQAEEGRVLPGVAFIAVRPAIEKALTESPDSVRLFAGYAGWGPKQLDFELKASAWHVLPGSAKIVFDPAPETLWERLIRKVEGISVKLIFPSFDTISHR